MYLLSSDIQLGMTIRCHLVSKPGFMDSDSDSPASPSSFKQSANCEAEQPNERL